MKRLISKREVRELVCYSFAHIDRLWSGPQFDRTRGATVRA
jgi:hypothetical protein